METREAIKIQNLYFILTRNCDYNYLPTYLPTYLTE